MEWAKFVARFQRHAVARGLAARQQVPLCRTAMWTCSHMRTAGWRRGLHGASRFVANNASRHDNCENAKPRGQGVDQGTDRPATQPATERVTAPRSPRTGSAARIYERTLSLLGRTETLTSATWAKLRASAAPTVASMQRQVVAAKRKVIQRAPQLIGPLSAWTAKRQDASKPPVIVAPFHIPDGAATVTFQGSGLLMVYEIGVAHYLSTHFQPVQAVSGASGGALVAALLACDVDMEEALALNNKMVSISGQRPLGPFVYGLQDLESHLVHLFPDDGAVATACTDRLAISLTRLPSLENKLVHR